MQDAVSRVIGCVCRVEWLRDAHEPEGEIVTPEPCAGNSLSALLGPKNLDPPSVHTANSPPPAEEGLKVGDCPGSSIAV